MKRNFIVILLLILSLTGNGQNISDSFYNRISSIYQSLEKNRVSSGLLKDYGIDFLDMENYTGAVLADSNMVSSYKWFEMYKSLYTYRINGNAPALTDPDTLADAIASYIPAGTVPLPIILMKYDRFQDNALTGNLLSVSNDVIYDKYVQGSWQNPYTAVNAFGVHPGNNQFLNSSVSFTFPSQFVFSNIPNVQSIEVNFQDGVGWRSVSYNSIYNITYQDTGKKVLQFKANLSGGQQLVTHSVIWVYFDPNSGGNASARLASIPPVSIAATNEHSGARLHIHYAAGHSQITNPLIIVEGFDPEKPSVNASDWSGFDQFWYDRSGYGAELNNIISNNVDIIYVDWNNGTDQIQRNAALLRDIINWVNTTKAAAGSMQQNVVIGFSMGGLVSRWCLRTMENQGLNHQTRLFVSYDAPHQGAFIPLAMQALNTHMANVPLLRLGSPIPGAVPGLININAGQVARDLRVYSTPGAKQMLMYYLQIAGNNGNGLISLNNSEFSNFMFQLRALGYPQNCRNVAMSHGSECGTQNGLQPGADMVRLQGHFNTSVLGDLLLTTLAPLGLTLQQITGYPGFLLTMLPGKNSMKCKFVLKALPETGTAEVYYGRIWIEKKVLWLINVTSGITTNSFTPPTGLTAFESYPGGLYDFNDQATSLRAAFAPFDFGSNDWEVALASAANNVLKKGIDDYYLAFPGAFNFVPTTSALDIGSGNVTLNKSDYLTRYVSTNPPAAPKNSPFANFVTTFNAKHSNSSHILSAIEAREGNWLAREINSTNPRFDCSSFCDLTTIAGDPYICTSRVYTVPLVPGTTYFWSVSNSSLATLNQNNNSVTVTRTGSAHGTITLYLSVNTISCGTFNLNRNVDIGIPTIPPDFNGMPTSMCEGTTFNAYSYSGNYSSMVWSAVNGQIVSGQGTHEIHASADRLLSWQTSGTFELHLQAYDACNDQLPLVVKYATVNSSAYTGCNGGGIETRVNVNDNSQGNQAPKTFNQLRLYPNPANSFFTLELPDAYLAGTITLISQLGQILKKETINSNFMKVPLQALAVGFYVAEITTKGGQKERRKFVIAR